MVSSGSGEGPIESYCKQTIESLIMDKTPTHALFYSTLY